MSTDWGSSVVNRKLRELVENDELDMEDPRQRDAYLRAWVAKGRQAFEDDEENGDQPSYHHPVQGSPG